MLFYYILFNTEQTTPNLCCLLPPPPHLDGAPEAREARRQCDRSGSPAAPGGGDEKGGEHEMEKRLRMVMEEFGILILRHTR